MKTALKVMMVVLLFSTALKAQEIKYNEPKAKKPTIQQKLKVYVGFNYENWKTDTWATSSSRFLNDDITTDNLGMNRLHLKITAPVSPANIIFDFMIPFSTQDEILGSGSIDGIDYVSHRKFNVLEIEAGIEFSF